MTTNFPALIFSLLLVSALVSCDRRPASRGGIGEQPQPQQTAKSAELRASQKKAIKDVFTVLAIMPVAIEVKTNQQKKLLGRALSEREEWDILNEYLAIIKCQDCPADFAEAFYRFKFAARRHGDLMVRQRQSGNIRLFLELIVDAQKKNPLRMLHAAEESTDEFKRTFEELQILAARHGCIGD